MTAWHGYFGIENINLNTNQRTTLVQALRSLGPGSDPQPAHLNHWRTRLDGDAAIFEARLNTGSLSVSAFKNRLGAIFSADPATIDHASQNQSFADGSTPVVTFSRSGTDYLRVALFGGLGADWQGSRREILGYLAQNRDDWDEPE